MAALFLLLGSESGTTRAEALLVANAEIPSAASFQPLSSASWQATALDLPPAWEVTKTVAPAAAAVVAVVDSGVSANQGTLTGRVLPGYDFVNNDADPTDDNGHGNAIANIIASTCPACRILPVKVLGSDHTGNWPTIAAGITWAVDHGAEVINLSIGAPRAGDEVGAAIAYAVAKGVIVVAAAGNDGENESFYPAMYPGVVAVAGVDESATRYPWSNYGPWVTVEAPGCTPLAGGAGDFCGTSAAAPFISGIAGLARTLEPQLAPAAFTAALRAASPPPSDPSTAASGLPDAGRMLAELGLPAAPPTVVTRPAASGTAAVGRRLAVNVGRWQFASSYSVQWQRSRDGTEWHTISAGVSYVLSRADAGYEFRVLVNARNARGSTVAASAATRRVPLVHRARPRA